MQTTASIRMQPNALSKRSRTHSSPPWQPPTWIFHYNFGTSLPHRSRTCSISFAHRGWPQEPQRTKHSTVRTIGDVTSLHRLGVKQSYTRPRQSGGRGHRGGQMPGIWTHPKITTDAICIMYQKHEHTVFQDQLSCSLSTVKSLTSAHTSTSVP